MILRRPYAFLIKHFKLIHLILFGLMVYITITANNVLKFFKEYISTNGNMEVIASNYISSLIVVVILLIIVLTIMIYLLMRYKKKPRALYVIIVLVILVSSFVFSYLNGNIKELETTVMFARDIRLLRDISRFNYWGLFLMCIPLLIRGLGFDIKKFNFSKDVANLKLDKEDSEEVEINSNLSSDMLIRRGHKFGREMKYYYLENKFILNIIFGIIAVVLVVCFPFNKFVVNKDLGEGDTFNTENFSIVINDSYISERNRTSKNNSYVILDVSVKGKSKNYKLRLDEFVLMGKDNQYIPSLKYYYYFSDLGKGYYNSVLDTNNYNNYILIYNVDNDDIRKKFTIRYIRNNRKFKIKPDVIS